MAVYWFLVIVPTVLAILQPARLTRFSHGVLGVLLVILFTFLTFRETGGDYPAYLNMYDIMAEQDLEFALTKVEPAYGLLNWLSSCLDTGIYGVNAICAMIFLYCLFKVALEEPDPLLFVTIAIPYFVIVVAMGYTRQGVAAGLILLSVAQLRAGRTTRSVLSICLAATFHFSAFAAMAVPIFSVSKGKKGVRWFASRLALFALAFYLVETLLSDKLDAYTVNYIESDRYDSSGAFLRSVVSSAAGILFFIRARDFERFSDYGIWRWFAILAIAATPLSFVASTPVDRVGLYLIPFQLIVFSRLPAFQARRGKHLNGLKAIILANYVVYFSVWMLLGRYSQTLWVPYRWYFS